MANGMDTWAYLTGNENKIDDPQTQSFEPVP